VFGGLSVPGDAHMFNHYDNDSFNPIIGGVFSIVRGRHGFNLGGSAEIVSEARDEAPDMLHYDASYLFRLAPARFDAETSGKAWYAVLELNGLSETNGDNELFLSPGIMYESKRLTIDAAIQFPVWQELDHRPDTEIIIALGARLSF
jgi:hypothetical protein